MEAGGQDRVQLGEVEIALHALRLAGDLGEGPGSSDSSLRSMQEESRMAMTTSYTHILDLAKEAEPPADGILSRTSSRMIRSRR